MRFPLPLLALLAAAGPAAAVDWPEAFHPVTYSTPSPNGRFLFVMLAPPSADPKRDPDAAEHARQLRRTYPASGLYPAGGTEPLWTADWYAYAVHPADDGVHLVREDSPARLTAAAVVGVRLPEEKVRQQLDGPGLTFLAHGKVLRTYAVRELVEQPEALPHSVTHVLWMADATITRDGARFVLTTQEPRQVVFDLATGEVVSRRPAGLGNVRVWVVRGLMAFVALFLAAAFARWLYFARKGTGA